MLNKGQCIGHIEPSIDHMPQTSIKSLTTQKMMEEHVQVDSFTPPLHTVLGDVKKSLNQLLETFKSEFAQNERSFGTTHLTKMQIDTGVSELVSQRPYPITVKQNDLVRSEINKLFDEQVIHSSYSSWSAPIYCSAQGRWWKCLVINYRALNKVTWKFMCPVLRVPDIISELNGAKYFSTLNLHAEYHHIALDEDSIPKTAFPSPFGRFEYLKVPLDWHKHQHISKD